ncbi:uncharacterized protein LOC121391585 [Gigantopelta aegis]|uniref:uncharacterized protein LOC121391585 n=1 Tax=Gigantopelta aegis TaxID=1735272 RepID=UPI001B88A430|nr:uncharacterized protein LOC121391585 [Gigantopelta aegis]
MDIQTPVSVQQQQQQQQQHLFSQPVSYVNTPPWVSDLLVKIEDISKRLVKLDIIENAISAVKNEVRDLGARVTEVEKSQQFLNSLWEESRTAHEKHIQAIDTELARFQKTLDGVMKDKDRLTEEIVDLQSRSMRDNLLFFNIKEGENENRYELIEKVCADKLEISDTLLIDRAHMIGKISPGRDRPIVVKFSSFRQKEQVRKSSFKLKNTNFGIGEQFPKAVQEKRKLLMPAFKKAREENRSTAVVRDKLYIDGKLYTCERQTVH